MSVQGAGRLLRFERGVPGIESAEDAALRFSVAAEAILAGVSALVVVTMRAARTHSHAKQMRVGHQHHDAEALHTGERIFGN